MVAGFALRLLKDKHPCSDAGNYITGSSSDSINKLIELQDRGGLMYPSRRFVCFVKLIFDILHLSQTHCKTEALVMSWKITLINLIPENYLVCGCNDSDHTNKMRQLILDSLCRIFFNNICMNSTNAANEKPKFAFKPSSKKVKKV